MLKTNHRAGKLPGANEEVNSQLMETKASRRRKKPEEEQAVLYW